MPAYKVRGCAPLNALAYAEEDKGSGWRPEWRAATREFRRDESAVLRKPLMERNGRGPNGPKKAVAVLARSQRNNGYYSF